MAVYYDPNSPMARRRLSFFTVSLFLLILFLTLFCYLQMDVKTPRKSPKKYYQGVVPLLNKNPSHRNLNDHRLPDRDSRDITYKEQEVNTITTTLHRSNKIVTVIKQSSTSLYNNTLTRYGATLKFNPFKSCPRHSIMTSNKKRMFIQKTSNCPQVFIIGAKKGGTTSLYQYISKHPDFRGIRLNETKWIGETFYFAQKFTKISLNSYLKQFPKGKMSGDASVDNLVHCMAPVRILKTCGGQVKIIILLRNPIQRYISNFMMRIGRDSYPHYTNYTSIQEQTKKEIKILEKALKKKSLSFPTKSSDWYTLRCLFECCQSMFYEGLYYVLVMNWLCNFPKENILFINSEEMFNNPVLILQQVLNFLGLKPLGSSALQEITSKVYNQGLKPFLPQHYLSPEDRRTLLSLYGPFNDAILKLLDWRQLDWSV